MKPSSRSLKKLPDQLALVQHHHSQASVELWTMDEHRIGFKPILRRIWAPKGATVKAPVARATNGCTSLADVAYPKRTDELVTLAHGER
jgi:hypothetical protein